MAKKSNKDFIDAWANAINNSKIKVKRYFRNDDMERETPYIFDGFKNDYETGERLVSFHTNKADNEGYILSYDKFIELFDEVEIEI